MGNHRAERRGSSRRPSDLSTPIEATVTPAVAETVALPAVPPTVAGKRRAEKPGKAPKAVKAPKPARAARVAEPAKAPAKAPARRASRRAAPRNPLVRLLPSPPLVAGVAALAISAGGAITAANGGLDDAPSKFSQASALSGASDVSRVSVLGKETVSRDSRRDALEDSADAELVAAAEDQLDEFSAARTKLATKGDQFSAKLALNQWVIPVSGYRLTARFGEYGLWSSYHTGLDFAADTGTPIHAIANGVVTSAGFDGAYGNKTVITLDDGTELWFCHQTDIYVSVGDEVRGGDLIGSVGSTGHVTGPHLHLEVRPGAGDPVDPYDALVVHGVTP